VAEHDDLDVLLVGRRTEPQRAEQASDEQEGDLTGRPDDPGRSASPLLRHQILSVHPSRYAPSAFPKGAARLLFTWRRLLHRNFHS
jgi:hypothetical protein